MNKWRQKNFFLYFDQLFVTSICQWQCPKLVLNYPGLNLLSIYLWEPFNTICIAMTIYLYENCINLFNQIQSQSNSFYCIRTALQLTLDYFLFAEMLQFCCDR